MRDAFLSGFADEVPYVLVDVELDAQADLRMIGRLVDGPDTPLRIGERVSVGFDPDHRRRVGPELRVGAMTRRRPVRGAVGCVAIAGYAQSPIQRHSDRQLGAIRGRHRVAIADAGLSVTDVDGFTTGSLPPTAGGHAAVDGVSIVTANGSPKRSA